MARKEIPFTGSTKQHRSLSAANQLCRNFYPEIVKDDNGKQLFRILIGSPGKTLLYDVSASPLRALHVSSSKFFKYWGVFGDKFYEFIPGLPPVHIGTLTTNNGPVFIDDNGSHILIVDGSTTGYVYSMSSGSAAGWTADLHATAADFIGGDYVVFCGGYFFVIQPGSNIIQSCTAPYGTSPTTWSSLDRFETSLQDAGPLISLAVSGDVLWALGDYSSLAFQNSGATSGFPFGLISGAPLSVGTFARSAVREINGSIIWPGKTKKGAGFVIKLDGSRPTNIATPEIANAIGKWNTLADAYADTYSEETHSFYQLTSPSGNQTLVYDSSTEEWHERSSYGLGRDRSKGHIFFNNQHIVGDSTVGKLYTQSLDVYTEDGNPLIATRRCQHLKYGRSLLEIPELIIDMDTGVGNQDVNDPQAILRYSIDGGINWSEELASSMGRIGDTSAIVRFPCLGTGEDWVFELTISDPVKRNIIGAYIGGD